VTAPATIGAAIRAARLAKGLSQSEVTAQMRPPLPYTCLSRWETGVYVPSIENLLALAAVIGPLDLPGPGGVTFRLAPVPAPGGGVIRVVPGAGEEWAP